MNYTQELQALLNNAYAPYSHFKVAAIVVLKDGCYFKGVNVENASYGGTICAERNAINNAIASGYKPGDFSELYLMVESLKISFPCFLCRQTIVEFFNDDVKIICLNKKLEKTILTVKDLCPYKFDRSDLQ